MESPSSSKCWISLKLLPKLLEALSRNEDMTYSSCFEEGEPCDVLLNDFQKFGSNFDYGNVQCGYNCNG